VTETDDTSNVCGGLYPVNSFLRGVAGEGIASDVIKCRLTAAEPTDYGVVFAGDDPGLQAFLARLHVIFPDGVCNWAKPGFGQLPPDDTWISFGPAGIEGDVDDGQVDIRSKGEEKTRMLSESLSNLDKPVELMGRSFLIAASRPLGALCGQRVQVPLPAPPGKTLLAFHRTLGRVRGTS
jgi:hypothetical protein